MNPINGGTVGVPPSTVTLTLPTGETVGLGDWIDDRLFSTVQVGNGFQGTVEAFSSARSQQLPGGTRMSTKVDTNIPRAGSMGLNQDQEAFVYGLAIKPVRAMRPVTAQQPTLGDTGGAGGSYSDPLRLYTLFTLDRLTYVAFEYNEKKYVQGTIADLPQGNGYHVFSTLDSMEIAQNGPPSPRDRIAMIIPVWMRSGLAYTVYIEAVTALAIAQPASDGNADLTYADIKVTFNGLFKKIVS